VAEDLSKLPYRWTARDARAAQRAADHTHDGDDKLYRFVTPYRLPPLSPEGARAWTAGQQVEISLAQSGEMWSVTRFFKDGYDWQTLPSGLGETKTLEALSKALFALDPVRWAPHDLSKMSAQAKSDFCLLHFEFWRNTDYRYAVTEIRPGGDPALASGFDYKLQKDQAGTLPVEVKSGAKIGWVLGKAPKPQPPIKPRPVPKPPAGDPPKDGPKTIVVTPLRPEIALATWRKQTLEVMQVDGTAFLASRLTFTVKLDGPSVKTTLQIRKNGDVFHEEVFDTGPFLAKGEHPWEWDGFDSDGVLDTELLKKNRWSARVLCVDKAGRTAFGSVVLTMTPGGMPWVDVVVKRADKRMEVTVYGVFANMRDVPAIPIILPGLLPTSFKPPSSMYLDDPTFESFRTNIITGIGKFWSRNDMSLGADTWVVATTCKTREKNAVPTILGRALTPAMMAAWEAESPIIGGWAKSNGVGRRSFNLATLQEGLPVVDLYIPPAVPPSTRGESDADREYTGAHELGHSVLRERGGVSFSLTHKGSSSADQVANPGTSAPAAPAEIDVMLYFKDVSNFSLDRVKAVEEDVRALVSLSKVTVT
jgi:hypothetical protein